jgi:5-hydroxyisourate hydrolase
MIMSLRVVDIVHGRPAGDLAVRLEQEAGRGWSDVFAGRTDADGALRVVAGSGNHGTTYRLSLDLAGFFGLLGIPAFYHCVSVTFRYTDPDERHDLTVVVSPVALATYHNR